MRLYFPFRNAYKFVFKEFTPKRRQVVNKKHSFQVIIFMLNDACNKPMIHLIILFEILIDLFDADAFRPQHIFPYFGEAQTTLLHHPGITRFFE
jgi:hypothetical protein